MANAETTNGILGVFKHLDCCVSSIEALKASGRDKLEVFSPVPSHEIQDALGFKTSRLGYATLAGALFGLVGGIWLSYHAMSSYELVVQGKPLVAWLPWFVVGFEATILFGCLANLITMFAMSGLPNLKKAPGYDERFSVDAFGIFVPCEGKEAEQVKALLQAQGAEEVHERP
jgi:molybdopterin-containing oxidoreductase family membrane subunit